jgi:hypothetical protein
VIAALEDCRHRFVFDAESGEIVCEGGCGWAVSVYEEKALLNAPRGRKLSSPSVRDNNLGSDQNEVIQDLRRGARDPETGKTVHLLGGALRFFPNRADRDEDLIAELSNRLHGRVSDTDLSAIAAIYRKVLRNLEREKRQKALEALDSITGAPPR